MPGPGALAEWGSRKEGQEAARSKKGRQKRCPLLGSAKCPQLIQVPLLSQPLCPDLASH